MITLTREEAQQVLDHLQDYVGLVGDPIDFIETLRARLAQPYKEQADAVFTETNGRMRIDPVTGNVGIGWASGPEPAETNERLRIGQDAMTWYDGQGNVTMKIDASGPLVISPHPAFAKSKRVYCSCGDGIVPDDGALCGTCVSLKKMRDWQGLTYKERNDCLVEADPCEALLDHEAHELMRTVEAKLKEKNT